MSGAAPEAGLVGVPIHAKTTGGHQSCAAVKRVRALRRGYEHRRVVMVATGDSPPMSVRPREQKA